ncbi:antigenic cell wall galactomannoprotein [Cladorrhinum sp. PSN259]|nr:antigenic cell wall galactomannoprotein [Cladorrhinum sp. PSN259]
MKPATLLLSLFTALAAPVSVLADGAAIVNGLKEVQSSTTKLGTAVTSWKGDLIGKIPILAGGLTLLATVDKATRTAKSSAPLDFGEAINVAVATTDLGTAVNTTLTALIEAKPKFDRRLLSPLILIDLGLQRKATAELSAEIIKKVPAELQDVAKALVKPVDDGFALAIHAFHGF